MKKEIPKPVKAYSVQRLAEIFRGRCLEKWWQTGPGFPAVGACYSKAEKSAREKRTDGNLNLLFSHLEQFPASGEEQSQWCAKARALITEAGLDYLEIGNSRLSDLFFNGMMQTTSDFIEEARRFDRDIKLEVIMQAMRNVWIMNCIQILQNKKVQYTPSVFAYSMLYPYTDNYLDNPGILPAAKAETSRRFKHRLAGDAIQYSTFYEHSLFNLVEMIEGQYDREYHPDVYESLLCIHRAQEKSLIQQDGAHSPYETDILGISFEKGGTSVLADAYLAAGTLSVRDAEFMFGYGAALQLMDDLQDAVTDARQGHATIFSQAAGKWPLDALTNKLIRFTQGVVDDAVQYSSPEMVELKEIIKKNCTFLILEAVSKNTGLFSRDYVKRLEGYSPFSFSYLRKLSDKFKKRYASLDRKFKDVPLDHVLSMAASQQLAPV